MRGNISVKLGKCPELDTSHVWPKFNNNGVQTESQKITEITEMEWDLRMTSECLE